MAIVRVSSKSQVVIPKEIRKKVNIKPNMKVLVKTVEDHIEIIPLPDDPIKTLTGIFKDYPGSLANELLEEREKDNKQDEEYSL
ncbi:MAG: AbrB/MazE/SpoVT family DNA-binding domain-containing protein [bacterium]